MRLIKIYIHEQDNWPRFAWDNDILMTLLGEVRNIQGKIVGKMESLGFELKSEAVLETLTMDVIKSTEIEGEILDPVQVRSSLARKLGMNISGLVYSERDVDGVVDMMFDATQNFKNPLSDERLFGWHSSLFPTGRSGIYKIKVGNWRDDSKGPMQVVSGVLGKEKVHYQAPTADKLLKEMGQFIEWFNTDENIDPVIKAGVAHLWFVTLHPFEDGNGRIARALTDLLLSRADGISQRYYSMSSQIRIERNDYYKILEKSQKGKLDITEWLVWFLKCLKNSLKNSNQILSKVINKHNFWNKNGTKIQNQRQKLLLNKLLDGFDGKLNSSKWGKIAKCSKDTALRDIQDLIKKGILIQEKGGGRNTSYRLIDFKN